MAANKSKWNFNLNVIKLQSFFFSKTNLKKKIRKTDILGASTAR